MQGRAHDIVEEECAVDENRKADDLEPFECLPAEGQRDEPDEECTGGVDGASGGGGDGAGDGYTEEVEATDISS